MDAEIDRLHGSIDNLTSAIRELRSDLPTVRENARTDFSRLVDRQDSQFRWLAGIIIASAVTIVSFVLKH